MTKKEGRRKKSILVVLVLIFGLVACSSGATQTPIPRPTPPPLQAAGWEGVTVHTICVEVEQSYPEIEAEFSEPIAEEARIILARVGLETAAGEGVCEATLAITLTGLNTRV